MHTPFALASLIALVLAAAAPSTMDPADAVYQNGKIYTVDPARSWVEAVAIDDGHFVAVGRNGDVAPYIGPKTRVVDLAGRMVMPGIHDMHEHPVEGGFQKLAECSFPFTTPLDAIAAAVRK
ncbi:MAG: amidohydrolase, partial [Myxococcota bacterium]